MASVRFNVTFSPDVFERVNAYCKSSGIPRSAFLQLAAGQYLDAIEAMPDVKKMFNALAAVTDGVLKGDVSPSEAQARMNAIQVTYEELTKKK